MTQPPEVALLVRATLIQNGGGSEWEAMVTMESRESELPFVVVVVAVTDPPASAAKPRSLCPVTLVPIEGD